MDLPGKMEPDGTESRLEINLDDYGKYEVQASCEIDNMPVKSNILTIQITILLLTRRQACFQRKTIIWICQSLLQMLKIPLWTTALKILVLAGIV